MTDTFDPNWPHGHEYHAPTGERLPARIICTDAVHPDRPIVVLIKCAGREAPYNCTSDGRDISAGPCRLFNKPAPKASGTDWVVRYRSPEGHHGVCRVPGHKDPRSMEYGMRKRGYTHLAIKRIDWTEGDTE